MPNNNYGWFKNTALPEGNVFVPTVNIAESISSNGTQYTASITSNIPNATIGFNLSGNIDVAEMIGTATKEGNITLNSSGEATFQRTFNTAIQSNVGVFTTQLLNFNQSNAIFTSGNTITLSGNVNLNTQVIPTNDQGSSGDGAPLVPTGNVTVGSDTYTYYTITSNSYAEITSFGTNITVQCFGVGGGAGVGGITGGSAAGGGYGGGAGGGGTLAQTGLFTIPINRSSYSDDFAYFFASNVYPIQLNVGTFGSAGANTSGTTGDASNGKSSGFAQKSASGFVYSNVSLQAPGGVGGRGAASTSSPGGYSAWPASFGGGGFGQAPGGGSAGANATGSGFVQNNSGLGGLNMNPVSSANLQTIGTTVGNTAVKANIQIQNIYGATNGSNTGNSLIIQIYPVDNSGVTKTWSDIYQEQQPFGDGAPVTFSDMPTPFAALNTGTYYTKWWNGVNPNRTGRGYEIYADADLTTAVTTGTTDVDYGGRVYTDSAAVSAVSFNLDNQGIGYGGNGGSEFFHDFTGSNVAYSGGGGGSASSNISVSPVNGANGYTTVNYGSGGAISWDGTAFTTTDGANGVVILRHTQNGPRALSMS